MFKVVGEWKAKAEDLHAELDACHSECRNFSAETFRLKAALDETNEQLDIVRRENKVIVFGDPLSLLTINTFRTLRMRSRIFWISLEMAAGPSTSWTNRGGGWRRRRKSCSQAWRRPKVLLRPRRTRCSGPPLSLARPSKRLIAGLRRKKKSSTTPGI